MLIVKEEAQKRGVGFLEYFNAMVESFYTGKALFPDDINLAMKYAAAIIFKRYPMKESEADHED